MLQRNALQWRWPQFRAVWRSSPAKQRRPANSEERAVQLRQRKQFQQRKRLNLHLNKYTLKNRVFISQGRMEQHGQQSGVDSRRNQGFDAARSFRSSQEDGRSFRRLSGSGGTRDGSGWRSRRGSSGRG